MPGSRRLIAAIFCGLVCACTPRADITPVSVPPGEGERVDVLVGTTRARAPDGLYHPFERAPLSFARFQVSVPTLREPGTIDIAGQGTDPAQRFAVTEIAPYSDAASFRRALAARLRETPGARGEVLIFVHGFNNTFGDSVFRAAQISTDLDLDAVIVTYAWPSRGQALGYAFDRDSALFARQGLQDLIQSVADAGADNIILLAHSLGSHLTMEALRAMAQEGRGAAWSKIGGVALMSPDIDVDVFRAQAADIGALPSPFLITTSSRDRALRLSARLTGQSRRLGNMPTVGPVSDLDVTVIDASQLRDLDNTHMGVVTSPTFLRMRQNLDSVEDAFQAADSGQVGLFSGTVLTVQNATSIMLEPVVAITEQVP